MKTVRIVSVFLILVILLSSTACYKLLTRTKNENTVTLPTVDFFDSATDPNDQAGDVGVNSDYPALRSFNAQTLDGGAFTAADLKKADITMINIWGTFCGPCLSEMPELAELATELPAGAQFITFCTDALGQEEDAQRILDKAGLTVPTLITAMDDLSKLLAMFEYIPTTVFVDADGNVIGEPIVGAPQNAKETYLNGINSALAAIGR